MIMTIFLILTGLLAVTGQFGGWSQADITNPQIQASTSFAVLQKYTSDPNVRFHIITAKQQVSWKKKCFFLVSQEFFLGLFYIFKGCCGNEI
jgi:hypothetical protein